MRKYKDYPKDIRVETKFGPVFLSITSGEHVYVDGAGNGKFIEVKGKKYSFSAHLKSYESKATGALAGEVVWELAKDEHGRTHSAVYAKKFQCYSRDDAMPPSYEKLVVAEIIEAVTAYLVENPDQLKLAAIADKNNALLRIEEKIADLEESLAYERETRDRLQDELDEVVAKPKRVPFEKFRSRPE